MLDGVVSRKFNINAGVPQGSVLSPTLFLIFIDDLLRSTTNPIHSFADDSTLHASFQLSKPKDLEYVNICRNNLTESINLDLAKISDWGAKNLVEFNSSKTQSCVFSNKRSNLDTNIDFEDEIVDCAEGLNILGIQLQDNLLWHDHMIAAGKSAACRLGFLRRCKKYLSKSNIILMYKAFIRPILEYNSHLWAGAPPSSRIIIDRIQRRALKIANSDEELDSLDHRRTVGAVVLFYRYYNGRCSDEISSIMPRAIDFDPRLRSTSHRNRFSVCIDLSRTDRFRNSFIQRTSRLWNLLPDNVFPAVYNVYLFKQNVNVYFKANPLSVLPGKTYPIF